MLQHVVFLYLANTGRFMLLIDNNLLLPGAKLHTVYWIISTENDHRHRHKFIKYEKRLRKEGNMPRLTYQAKSLPLQREFVRVALPSVRSNGPTDPLHISCICSIWKILHFYSRGGSRGGGGLKLEKIWLFGVKSWFFTRNTPTICLSPPPNLTSWIRPCIPLSLWIHQSPLSSTRWHFLFCPRTTCCLLFLNSAHAQDGFIQKAIWIDLNIVIQDNNSDNSANQKAR